MTETRARTPPSADRYGLFGNPVGHSKSPRIHARFAELTGEHLQYEAMLVPLDGWPGAVAQFVAHGGRGANVTVPFKQQAFAMADERSDRAALAGACNTLRFESGRVLADNTDGVGLLRDLQVNAGFDLSARRVLLIGAGGAGAGVLGPLLHSRPGRLVVANRSVPRALALVTRHAPLAAAQAVELQACGLDEVQGEFDLVINASSSSLGGSAVPVPSRVLAPRALACDLMYGPAAQGFADWARAHGARTRDGLGMLVEQAAESFLIWRGIRPPAAQVLAELRASPA
jgi:shikimate dehydrogenase